MVEYFPWNHKLLSVVHLSWAVELIIQEFSKGLVYALRRQHRIWYASAVLQPSKPAIEKISIWIRPKSKFAVWSADEAPLNIWCSSGDRLWVRAKGLGLSRYYFFMEERLLFERPTRSTGGVPDHVLSSLYSWLNFLFFLLATHEQQLPVCTTKTFLCSVRCCSLWEQQKSYSIRFPINQILHPSMAWDDNSM